MKLFSGITLGVLAALSLLYAADENYVTVYNDNLALVKQVRTLKVSKDQLPLRFTDVAAQLIPTSVHLRSLDRNSKFQVLEQNFEYDLVSAEKILEKYIDHEIEVITKDGELVSGTLLSRAGKSFVLKTGEGIKLMPWNDEMVVNVKDLPEGLITRPTLIWDVSGIKANTEKLEVSYLTRGMQWHAEYVGVLNEASDQLNLDAWVSLDNHSGATFNDAHLKLVAGEIHRAPQPVQPYRRMTKGLAEGEVTGAQGFEEREFFEYHIYDLGRPSTIRNNQIKQISLFPPAQVDCEKKFYYNASRDAKKVAVKLLFRNIKKSGLGMPLPAGVFRLYQKDKESLEFVGEDRIEHTPRNEEVKVTVGNAFDLVGERRVTDRKKLSKRSERQTVEIELRNNKEKGDVIILVEEQLYYRNWKIEESNFTYSKRDANRVEFNIPVKADGKSTLRYTITYSW